MKYKLSPWHSADTKPVRVGVYQVVCKSYCLGIEFSFWNGIWWAAQEHKQKEAEKFCKIKSDYQNKQWRGIVK